MLLSIATHTLRLKNGLDIIQDDEAAMLAQERKQESALLVQITGLIALLVLWGQLEATGYNLFHRRGILQ
jgi:hypothetical protein